MNIAFVKQTLYPATGSGAYYDVLTRRLARQGNRVWLISSVAKDVEDFRRDGVQFVHVPAGRSTIPFTSLLRWEWRASRMLRKIEAEQGLDLVEFHSYLPEGLVHALARRRAKICIRIHEWRTPISLSWFWRDPRDALREALCWAQMARADVLLPVSAAVHETCIRFMGSDRYARKIFAIRPAMDMELYSPAPLPPSAYRALEGKRIILFVGRITKEKGTYNLIEAFRDRIAPRFGDAALVLIGTPEEPDQLRRALESCGGTAIHLQDVETKDMPGCYSHAYVFVGPSANEAFGAVFVEALACGLPVVSVAKGGPLEIVMPEETGLLCPDNSADAIAAALERLLADRELRDRMARSARASVVDRFGLERLVSELMHRYSETTGRGNGR